MKQIMACLLVSLVGSSALAIDFSKEFYFRIEGVTTPAHNFEPWKSAGPTSPIIFKKVNGIEQALGWIESILETIKGDRPSNSKEMRYYDYRSAWSQPLPPNAIPGTYGASFYRSQLYVGIPAAGIVMNFGDGFDYFLTELYGKLVVFFKGEMAPVKVEMLEANKATDSYDVIATYDGLKKVVSQSACRELESAP